MIRKPVLLGAALIAAGSLLTLVLGGCGRTQPTKDADKVKVGPNVADENLATASKLLREAASLEHYRNGLNLVNTYVDKTNPKIPELTKAKVASLGRIFALDEEHLNFLSGTRFKLQDAYHVESCFLFRDAARFLEVPGLPRADQVAHLLDWVSRRVLLFEQGDGALPPSFVIKRGYGGALDRALVLLELLRQLELPAGLVMADLPEGPDVLLVGVLLSDGKASSFALFDPRLGKPATGADGKTLTLPQALGGPESLKSLGLSEATKGKLELRVACPLPGLAPRMDFLEDKLKDHQRIVLFQDAAEIVERLGEATGLKVAAWDKPGKENVPPPHRLTQLIPGEDTSKNQRLSFFEFERIPQGDFEQLHELPALNDLDPRAHKRLDARIRELFEKFYLQPQEMLARGKPDDAVTRINRIVRAFDDLDRTVVGKDLKFAQEVGEWVQGVNNVYTALARKDKDAEMREANLWTGDKYIAALLDFDSEWEPKKHIKQILTFVLLRACQEAMGKETAYLWACALNDKAQRQQALLDAGKAAGKESKSQREATRTAWSGAAVAWKSYGSRYLVGREVIAARLPDIQKAWDGGEKNVSRFWLERLQRELHQSIAARYFWARAEARGGDVKAAQTSWERLRADVEAINADRAWADLTARYARDAEDAFLTPRLALLARDWSPDGAWATWTQLLRDDLAK